MLQNLELIIIDEMSLLSSDYFYRIHMRLKEIFQSEDPFANKSVLLVGDLLQLPPIGGRYIFESPKNGKLAISAADLDLWQKFDVYVLKHNHRQGERKMWANTLNEIREGIVTEDTIKLLRSKLIEPDDAPNGACHICYTNKEVFSHNENMLNSLPSDLVTLPAREFLPRGYVTQVKSYGTIKDTKFMQTLKVKKNAWVKLIWNVSTMDGLVNGAMGTVKSK